MSMQTTTIEIDSVTAALLRNKAAAEGVSLEVLLRDFAANINGKAYQMHETARTGSLDEFMSALESLAEDLPPSKLSYTREDIYFDHD